MDKKALKEQYLRMRLNDPDVTEYEKKHIRQRLGIAENIVTEKDFIEKTDDALLHFVSSYLEDMLTMLRRKKQVKDPFSLFSDNVQTIYYLSSYSASFDDDSLEQMYDVLDTDQDMKALSNAFRKINRDQEANLIDSVLVKKKIKSKDIKLLQDHFWEDDATIDEINQAINTFIVAHVKELVDLQNM